LWVKVGGGGGSAKTKRVRDAPGMAGLRLQGEEKFLIGSPKNMGQDVGPGGKASPDVFMNALKT